MTMKKYSSVSDDGSLKHILKYEETDKTQFERVEILFHGPNSQQLSVHCFKDGEEVYQMGFTHRDLTFDPVSIIGKGESQRMDGVSQMQDDDIEIPYDVQLALNTLGFAPVPPNDWWLHGN